MEYHCGYRSCDRELLVHLWLTPVTVGLVGNSGSLLKQLAKSIVQISMLLETYILRLFT